MTENNSFSNGIKKGLPICFGYLSVSFAFGVFAVGYGLSIWEAVLLSMTNLTSAGQLAAVPIIAAGGSLLELAATQFVINLRYMLMSISLSQKMGASVRLRDKFIIGFAVTDEIFAVASVEPGAVGRKFMFGLSLTPFVGWTIGTLLGALAGNFLPDYIISALGIAIYAMFIAIVVPVARKSRPVLFCVILAAGLSVALKYIPVVNRISSGFVIIIAGVAAAAISALLFPIPRDDSGEPEGEVSGSD